MLGSNGSNSTKRLELNQNGKKMDAIVSKSQMHLITSELYQNTIRKINEHIKS